MAFFLNETLCNSQDVPHGSYGGHIKKIICQLSFLGEVPLVPLLGSDKILLDFDMIWSNYWQF